MNERIEARIKTIEQAMKETQDRRDALMQDVTNCDAFLLQAQGALLELRELLRPQPSASPAGTSDTTPPATAEQ